MSKAKRRGRLIVGGVGLAAAVAGLVAFSGSAKAAEKAPQFPSNMVVVYNAAQAKAAEDLADKKVERGEADGVVMGSSMSGEAVSNAVLGQLAEVARAYPSVHFVIGVGTRVGPPVVSALASSSKASGTYVSDAEEIAAYPTAVADAAFYAFNGRQPGDQPVTPPGPTPGPAKPATPPKTVEVDPSTYDPQRFPNPRSIRQAFADLLYIPQSEVNSQPMNGVGPDGKLGGGDDVPSSVVRSFQREFNKVAGTGAIADGKAYRVDVDGFVGPQTLNALQLVLGDGVPDPDAGSVWRKMISEA